MGGLVNHLVDLIQTLLVQIYNVDTIVFIVHFLIIGEYSSDSHCSIFFSLTFTLSGSALQYLFDKLFYLIFLYTEASFVSCHLALLHYFYISAHMSVPQPLFLKDDFCFGFSRPGT